MSALTGACHPACLLLPEMTEQEYRELVEDIRAHGQRHPIIVDDGGVILDGRHRWRVCQEQGIEPGIRWFKGHSEAEKVALVISANIHRRHLTTDQRAAIAAELATMKQGTRTDLGQTCTMSAAEAAQAMRVSERTVKSAKARMRADPEAHEQAKAGRLKRRRPSMTKALDRAKAREQRKAKEGAPPAPASVDDLRDRYVAACQHWPHERRVKEIERVIWALGTPAKSWGTVQLPKPEPGASRWEDGCFIRQMEAWAAAMLDADRVSPSAMEMLGDRLMALGRSRIGAPAAAKPAPPNMAEDELVGPYAFEPAPGQKPEPAVQPGRNAYHRYQLGGGLTIDVPAFEDEPVEVDQPDDDLRRRLSDRLADCLDDAGIASEAQKIGIGAPTLKSFLAGNPIYDTTRTKIEAYLSN